MSGCNLNEKEKVLKERKTIYQDLTAGESKDEEANITLNENGRGRSFQTDQNF